MPDFLPTIILRHRKENLKKCSLRGLEDRMHFVQYPNEAIPDLTGYVVLTPDAPLLEKAKGLCLIMFPMKI